MKGLVNKYPIGSRFVFGMLLFALVLVLSAILDTPFLKQYFPYTTAILLGSATWLLFKFDKQSLGANGLSLRLRHLSFLPFGVLIGALALLAAKYARALYAGESFAISESTNYSTVFYALYAILPTVAVEEFLFRGYLFKKTIEVSNVIIANVIFSILFMAIHVLDKDIIHNKGMVIFLLISIPVGHLLFATALLKSKTLFFPIGLHLGNNWASRHVITTNDYGNSFLFTVDSATFNTWPSFIGFIFIFNGVFLLITVLIWKWNAFPFNRKA